MSENRVKVSYTLDLEEVPALVDTLLSECRQKLAKELNELKVSLHDVPQAVMQINETREALAMITTQLEDIINLAAGWYNTVNPPQQNFDLDPDEEERAGQSEENQN